MIVYSTNKKVNTEIKKAKYNTQFRIIRRFIRVVKSYGYEARISEKHRGSFYVNFSKVGANHDDFIFRFSDHLLSLENQVPAGVIEENATLSLCIRFFQRYVEMWKKMSKEDQEYIWTNRGLYSNL